MSTVAPPPPRTAESDRDQCVVLRDIGWEGYSAVLKLRGDRPVPRMVYLDGSVLLMSPSYPHEHSKERLGRFVTEVVRWLKIPCNPSGSTTFRRRARRGGAEGDLSYYLAHEALIRGKKRIDLRVDPPPDLVIEVVETHPADAAIEVFRRLRVPEVWICGRDELTILILRGGRYVQSDRSAAFPFLTADEIFAWVRRPETGSENQWLDDLYHWVLEVLIPRVRQPEGGA